MDTPRAFAEVAFFFLCSFQLHPLRGVRMTSLNLSRFDAFVSFWRILFTATPSRPVQMTSSRVRLGQSFKTVGYGCTSCWGDVGAGDEEADVFYIPFIGSVQYIGY